MHLQFNLTFISYREQTDSCQIGGDWGLGAKDEEIKKYRLVVMKQSRDIKFSIGNIVDYIVITMRVPGGHQIY